MYAVMASLSYARIIYNRNWTIGRMTIVQRTNMVF